MTRFNQHTPFIVLQFECDVWPYPSHNHNHFEIILIRRGKGKHIINGIPFSYGENDLYLIAPDDTHAFEVAERTHFCYLKFTDMLFRKDGNLQEKGTWMKKIESILHNPNQLPGDVEYREEDQQQIGALIDVVLKEYYHPQSYSDEILCDALSMILSLMARNICSAYCGGEIPSNNSKERISEILIYIRRFIYEPELLKIESLSAQFNLSANYFGIFFKKQTGVSVRKYIQNYRLAIAENRVRLSDYTISEIAHQLGFSDESHLHKDFLRKYRVSPGYYRKKYLAERQTQFLTDAMIADL